VPSSEFELLAALRDRLDGDGPGIPLGVGDDAAVIHIAGARVAIAVDAVVVGVHADLRTTSYADLGWRALAVNLSDLAAIGARPVAAVVALARPRGTLDDDVMAIYRGLRAAADDFGVVVVGGDTVTADVLSVTVTLVGEAPAEPLRRDAAVVGDAVVLVGDVGLAGVALAAARAGATGLLDEYPRVGSAHRRPRPLVAEGVALAEGGAHACIDVSDGLGRDLGHIAAASGVGIVVDRLTVAQDVATVAARVGVDAMDLAIGGGDDYALAATIPADRVDAVVAATGGRVIGAVVAGSGVTLVVDGESRDVTHAGWEHGG